MFYVYILASKKNGTLYIGVTQDLIKRVLEHKNDLVDGFTKEHQVHKLIYYEGTSNPSAAIAREKRIKKWNRQWKIRLIESMNPHWNDLYTTLINSELTIHGSPIRQRAWRDSTDCAKALWRTKTRAALPQCCFAAFGDDRQNSGTLPDRPSGTGSTSGCLPLGQPVCPRNNHEVGK